MVKIILSAALISKYWTWPHFTAHISLGNGKHSEGEHIQKFTDTVKIILFSTNVQLPSLPYILHERPYELSILQVHSDTNTTRNSFATKSNFVTAGVVNAKELDISIHLSSLSAHCFGSIGRHTGMLHVPYFPAHKMHRAFFIRNFREKKKWWMYFHFSNLLQENRIVTYQN
jgi:hypothetical protein